MKSNPTVAMPSIGFAHSTISLGVGESRNPKCDVTEFLASPADSEPVGPD